MRSSRTVSTALLGLLIAAGAFAQDKPPVANSPPKSAADPRAGHWLASGFVGSNFGSNAEPASTAFGASLGYLFRDRIGAEFDAGVTPDFHLQGNRSGAFGADGAPRINSYMANGVWAVPLEGTVDWRPFVSAGVGALTLRSGFAAGTANAFDPDDSRLGANVGGGVMAFSGSWGFKADVRYFRAAGSSNSIPIASAPASTLPTVTATMPVSSANAQADAALSGLHFWRANVGLAIRW
ncbi:MAG TPA: outer membrane beta-barrel protein [Vicinamibacterales bacterium]|nr:outer membrane beta-barrel protein [Vicinamibacterales bacterium]